MQPEQASQTLPNGPGFIKRSSGQGWEPADQVKFKVDSARVLVGQTPVRARVQFGSAGAIHVAAAEVRDATMRARVYDALGKKYFATPEDAKFLEIFGRVDDPATVYLQLIPEDGLTWEY